MGKVGLIGSNCFTGNATIVYKGPGVGGIRRDNISISIGRADGECTCRADGFSNGLDRGFRVYLYAYLEGLSDAGSSGSRGRGYGVDDCLYLVGGIGELLANGSLCSRYRRLSSDIVVRCDSPGVSSSCRDDI